MRTTGTALSASKLNPSNLRFLLCFSSKPHTNPPPPYDESVVTQSLKLLEPPPNQWKLDQLRPLLFSASPPSHLTILHITRRLSSLDKALYFLQCLETNSSPIRNTDSLSSSLQAALEIAAREANSTGKMLGIFKRAQKRDIPLTANAATLLLSCFGRAGLTCESLAVFKYLHPSLRNTDGLNALMKSLLERRCVVDALKVLDEMLKRDSEYPPNKASWWIVRPYLVKPGGVLSEEQTVGLLLRLSKHRIFPSYRWLSKLITKLCRGGKAGVAWDLFHGVVVKNGCCAEIDCCNALLSELGKNRDLNRMNTLMAEMKELGIEPDGITFGILLKLMCKWRMIDGALELLEKLADGEEGVSAKPDLVMYNTVVYGLCKVGRHDEAFALVERMRLQSGCAPDDFTYNGLIDGCCRAGEFERAMEILDRMTSEGIQPCEYTINIFVNGFCRHGKLKGAVEFVDQMQRKGLKCDYMLTYNTLIKSYCDVHNFDKGIELFDRMLSEARIPDAIKYSPLIIALCRAGRIDDAMATVSKLNKAGLCVDSLCFNNLVVAFCKHDKLDKAYEVLKVMEDANVKPISCTYNALISYFGRAGDLTAAHAVWKEMINAGIRPDGTYGTLIHAYCKQGKLDEAMVIFNSIKSPNDVVYRILIKSLCKNRKEKLALSLMNDMKAKGMRPSSYTYNCILKGLHFNNMLEEAFTLMDRMVEENCKPDYITMEILLDWLPAVGEMDKLKRFTQGGKVSDYAECRGKDPKK